MAVTLWKTPPPSLKLADNDVHVWRTDLDVRADTLHVLQKTLSADEQEKASRFHFEKDRLRYVIAHGVLRYLAAGYSGQKPEDLQFSCNQWGKPAFRKSGPAVPLQFNLSHSGEIVLHAFSLAREIGID